MHESAAVRVDQEHSGPVALKLARYPWDRRFDRQAELLSRIHDPSVPRLFGEGIGTDDYRSPEAWLFHLSNADVPEDCFQASAADDLYALGVAAYRLVTGGYPPRLMSLKNAAGTWRIEREDPRPGLEHRPRLDPLLREWILRLLSLSAEERAPRWSWPRPWKVQPREPRPLLPSCRSCR
jgi:serine/threonine protein kinase